MRTDELLVVDGLTTDLTTQDGVVSVLEDVSLRIAPGETVGLVGESGCGKSMTGLSIMQLLPRPVGETVAGSVSLQGRNILDLPADELRRLRGRDIAMVFQDAASYLNPVLKVREQIGESVKYNDRQDDIPERVDELLDLVGLPRNQNVADRYPHELSGGMRQRVLIAIALAGRPKLLIADEPTTALDVTIQAQILAMLGSLQERLGMALLLITHDIGVVAETCDRVYVMYAGKVVEEAPVMDLFAEPRHPYTMGLLHSIVRLDDVDSELYSIDGVVPDLAELPDGCRFHPRCPFAQDDCGTVVPALERASAAHAVACHYAEDIAHGRVTTRHDLSAGTHEVGGGLGGTSG